jgi:hypothetical protein
MRRSSLAKALSGVAAILILAAGCTQSPTAIEANDGPGNTQQGERGVYAYGED